MMQVLLSTTPLMFVPRGVRAWVYFGKDPSAAERLQKIIGIPPMDYSKKLYEISEQCRADFVRWMDEIAFSGNSQPEWFFSVPAVKNTHFSDLFLNICYLLTVNDLLKNVAIDLIVVDSPALADVLLRQSGGALKPSPANWAGVVVRQAGMLIRSCGRFLKFCAGSWSVFRNAQKVLGCRAVELLQGKDNIAFIRNYISGDFSDGQESLFEKHYFPGLPKYLQEQGKIPVFLSVPIRVKSFKVFFDSVKKSAHSIVFAEEFLQTKDYFYAWMVPLRAFKCRKKAPVFYSMDVQPLLDEDYKDNITDPGLLRAALLSRIGGRLKKFGIRPEVFVNWSEFQAFEKGLVYGLREAFPQMKLIASQPFCSAPNHLSLFPSLQEKVLNMVPDKLLVLGPMARERAREFNPNISVGYSPAFRYTHLFDAWEHGFGKGLLVLFGYSLPNSVRTMKLLLDIERKLSAFDRVLIKIHPSGYFGKKELLRAVNRPLPSQFHFVEGGLKEYLPQVSVGLCGATGTAVELVTRGIPVVVAGETTNLTMNYLIKDAHPDLWRLCFSGDDIASALNVLSSIRAERPERLKESAEEFRKSYFAEQSAQWWANYLPDAVEEYHYAA